MKQRLFFAFFSLIQCVCSSGMQLNVVRVGPANCTVFKMNNRALIYDCGYSAGNWMSNGRFTYEKRTLFTNIMSGIEEVGIVISHDDKDHKNLLPAVGNFLGDKIKFIINIKDQDALPTGDLCNLQTFFDGFYIFPIIPDFREDSGVITTNDKSLILKIVGVSEGQGYSFLMTGDATEKTLGKILRRKVIFWDNPDLGDTDQYWRVCFENLFTDVISFMPAHHATDTEGSLVWSDCVLNQSNFPVLTIISSDPSVRNQSPTLDSIHFLNKAIVSNLQRTTQTHSYFCVPHDIDCYYEAFTIKDKSLKFEEDNSLQVIKYPSFYNGFVVPIFVTSNSQSGIYTVSLNPDLSVTFFDNAVQLYGCNMQGVNHELLSNVCTAYMHYYASNRLKEEQLLYNLLQHDVIVSSEGELNDFSIFVERMPAIIKNAKVSSYLAQIIPLLNSVIEQTGVFFQNFQNFDVNDLPYIDMPFGNDYLRFLLDTIFTNIIPQDSLLVLFNHYSEISVDFSSSKLIDAAVDLLRRQHPRVDSSSFPQFLESIGVANEKGAFQKFLYSKMVR